VLIVGDFTRLVGDPSGQGSTRPLISAETIHENMTSYRQQAFKILDPERTEVRYNSEWLGKMGAEGLIQLSSKYTVARMLERDDFSKRFAAKASISVLEFLYPLLQAYDSVAIEADVELGGHDQLFNLLIGRDIQTHYGQAPQVVMTVPLLIGTDGTQAMGQSKGNYIGIDEPPSEVFGKLMSLPDTLMPSYYELLTDVAWDEVEGLHPKACKLKLARLLVEWLYDSAQADAAEESFERVYARKELPQDMPEVVLQTEDLDDGRIWIVALLDRAKLVDSRAQARRLIEQGGVQIDGQKVKSIDLQVEPHEGTVLKVGKHKFAKIALEER